RQASSSSPSFIAAAVSHGRGGWHDRRRSAGNAAPRARLGRRDRKTAGNVFADMDPAHDLELERARSKAERALFAPGICFGRYVAIQRIGAGAMGVVYSAYDPQLERNVAI